MGYMIKGVFFCFNFFLLYIFLASLPSIGLDRHARGRVGAIRCPAGQWKEPSSLRGLGGLLTEINFLQTTSIPCSIVSNRDSHVMMPISEGN